MRKRDNKKRELTTEIREKLNKLMEEADATRKYRQAIALFEKHQRKYEFDPKVKYKLGFLYDHLAIFKTSKLKNTEKRRALTWKYLNKAEMIYKEILKTEENNLFALRGLARINEARKRYREAINYARKAYNEIKKLPRGERGVLGVGSFYESRRDFKGAERWYKKELDLLGDKNLGAIVNIMNFYKRRGKFKKARSYAVRAEKFLIDLGLEKSKSKTIQMIYSSIKEVKEKADTN